MSVTVDVVSENIAAADPQSYTHAGGTSPQGVLVFIGHDTISTDIVAGVTYGGSALTRIRTDTDTATEPSRSYIYFLGTSVPSGNQTVSVDRTQATESVHVVTITLDAADNLEVIDNDGISISATQANPQVTLQFSGRSAMSFCVLVSGHGALASVASLSGQTRVHDHDFGAYTSYVDRLTTAQTADDTIGYTATAEDVAFSACAVTEVLAAAVPPNSLMLMGAGV